MNTKTLLWLLGGGVLLYLVWQGYKTLNAGVQAVATAQPQ